MSRRERENRIFKRMKGVVAAGLSGFLFAAACLPMNVSASETITRENFDYVRYADDYLDLKAAFGYDAEALYNHYLNNGRAEGRIAYYTDGSVIGGESVTENPVETESASEPEPTPKKKVTPQEQALIDAGWEWNSNWGMWVR